MINSLRLIAVTALLLLLFIFIAAGIARVWFHRQFNLESREILEAAQVDEINRITTDDLDQLPVCVRKWLIHSGVVGQPRIHTVRLTQTGRMRTAPDKPWMSFNAVQYINADQPAFVWQAQVKMAPLIELLGKDRFYEGHGSMIIKLLALLPVVNEKSSKEIDQGAMMRYLAEMMWYPAAALNDYISWESVDENTARATMKWHGQSASMRFHFNQDGDMISCLGPRYQAVDGKFILRDWGGISRSFKEFNDIRIPNQSEVIWKYENGDFNWLQLEVTDIDFNSQELYS